MYKAIITFKGEGKQHDSVLLESEQYKNLHEAVKLTMKVWLHDDPDLKLAVATIWRWEPFALLTEMTYDHLNGIMVRRIGEVE